MKNKIEAALIEVQEKHGLDSSLHGGLRLEWYGEGDFVFCFKGNRFKPKNNKDIEGFLESVVAGKEKTVGQVYKETLEKEKKKKQAKKEEKKEEKKATKKKEKTVVEILFEDLPKKSKKKKK